MLRLLFRDTSDICPCLCTLSLWMCLNAFLYFLPCCSTSTGSGDVQPLIPRCTRGPEAAVYVQLNSYIHQSSAPLITAGGTTQSSAAASRERLLSVCLGGIPAFLMRDVLLSLFLLEVRTVEKRLSSSHCHSLALSCVCMRRYSREGTDHEIQQILAHIEVRQKKSSLHQSLRLICS